jgi:hypothetical protein
MHQVETPKCFEILLLPRFLHFVTIIGIIFLMIIKNKVRTIGFKARPFNFCSDIIKANKKVLLNTYCMLNAALVATIGHTKKMYTKCI